MFVGFWLAHLLHMFYSFTFPFKSQQFMTSNIAKRRFHFIELVVIITLGLLCSMIVTFTSGYGFSIFPETCTVTSLVEYFYTQVLPVTVGFSIGVLLLCVSVFIVRKVS